MATRRGKRRTSRPRRISFRTGLIAAVALALWGLAGVWFVHHPRKWLDETCAAWPQVATDALFALGNPVSDVTDGLGWTGHDAVYEYDTAAPAGAVCFAGLPRRVGPPAPADIVVLDRGPFKVGWSDTLRHPAWCAYHVVRKPAHKAGKRPGFFADRAVPKAPRPDDYAHSGYDRGHMAPNHAIATRYGEAAQHKTFLMSNISPQTPNLNRGVWRDVEHRIAEFWTARYGEIWVVVGCVPSRTGAKIPKTGIDIPDQFFQVVIAQEGMDVRALAVVFPQNVAWDAWAARHIVSIDELEELTGLDFNPDLPAFIQDPLEADLPTRLWPVRLADILSQFASRFHE